MKMWQQTATAAAAAYFRFWLSYQKSPSLENRILLNKLNSIFPCIFAPCNERCTDLFLSRRVLRLQRDSSGAPTAKQSHYHVVLTVQLPASAYIYISQLVAIACLCDSSGRKDCLVFGFSVSFSSSTGGFFFVYISFRCCVRSFCASSASLHPHHIRLYDAFFLVGRFCVCSHCGNGTRIYSTKCDSIYPSPFIFHTYFCNEWDEQGEWRQKTKKKTITLRELLLSYRIVSVCVLCCVVSFGANRTFRCTVGSELAHHIFPSFRL